MVLPVVYYGHPALRTPGKHIEQVDNTIRQLACDMLETMVAYEGVGLAAHQIGLPIRLAVVDVSGVKQWPSELRINGKKQSVRKHSPLILLNAEVEPFGEETIQNEGCLSFPDIHGDIPRTYSVRVKAHTLDGEVIEFEADGFLARAIQHEQDHLDGVLFIDRMESSYRQSLADNLRKLQNLAQ